MNILHVAPLSWHNPNGVTESVVNLALAQSQFSGVRVGLLVSSPDPGVIPPLPVPTLLRRDMPHLGRGMAFWETLCSRLFIPDVVVFHSTFVPYHARIAHEFRRRGIPYIICPHGGMTREALASKAWKKWVGRRAFFDALVAGATALQYLTQGEYERSGDWKRPVIIAGNGIWPPSQDKLARPGTRSMRQFVFLGRLHIEHKGLDILIEAVARCQDELRRSQARVQIVGSDYAQAAARLQTEIARLSLSDIVSVKGPVWGEAKSQLLASADVFLHPSRTEGHPMAVLEALAYGVPVLITPQTNVLHEVQAAKAGWGVTGDRDDLARSLVRLSRMSPQLLAAAGRAARQLALERLTWEQAAEKTLAKYSRVVCHLRAA